MPGTIFYPAMSDVGIVAVMYRVRGQVVPHLQFANFLLSRCNHRNHPGPFHLRQRTATDGILARVTSKDKDDTFSHPEACKSLNVGAGCEACDVWYLI